MQTFATEKKLFSAPETLGADRWAVYRKNYSRVIKPEVLPAALTTADDANDKLDPSGVRGG